MKKSPAKLNPQQRLKQIRRARRERLKSFAAFLGESLTPQVFKETRQAASRRKKPAWDLKPLLLLSLTMT
ncbi:MAG: hypothetical protein N2C14_14045, partial [Planctomycetales bacterium]